MVELVESQVGRRSEDCDDVFTTDIDLAISTVRKASGGDGMGDGILPPEVRTVVSTLPRLRRAIIFK